jgi:hypothetical protein
MNTEDRVTGLIADANPVPGTSPRSPQELAEAERVMQRVLSAAWNPSARTIRGSLGSIAAAAGSVLVAAIVVVVVLHGHARPVPGSHPVTPSSGSFPFTSTQNGLGSPAIDVPPGRLALANLGVHNGASYLIYGQRIRFIGRLYFCFSGGNSTGGFQICPPWPLTHKPTAPLIGGLSRGLLLALAVAPRDQKCTFVGLDGGPIRTSRVPIPATLKVDGEIVYAFVKASGGGKASRAPAAHAVYSAFSKTARTHCGL